MATLSKVTSLTRTLIKWAGLGLGAFLIILLLYRIAIFVKQQITPPPPPTVAFGKLPEIVFPKSQTNKTLSYSIDTVTGALPVFSDRANVYKIAPAIPDLLAFDKATKKLNSIGFNGTGNRISENLYEWTSKDTSSQLQKRIVFNIFSANFNLSSTSLEDPEVLAGNNLPNQTAAINTAESFLSNLSATANDIDLEKTQAALFSIKNGNITPTVSLSSTQIIRVSFFQKDLDGFPIVYPTPNSSTMTVLVGGGLNSPQVVQADFSHQSITSESTTYPILSTSQAFDKLQDGEAYIASFNGEDQEISIKKVTLAYYLSDAAQTYVMPVIVFKGSSDFTAYVPAIRDDWIQK